ncbi:hypothetical protein A306_00000161 [Columba livia]|uniref:Cation exchanger C521.04c n=1 Tax=Columba livia TaxID=8932 RepID=A0A2I0LXC1_COLLI|nr:hypothetical protein A306_00000161 [Columba livia]
MTPVSPTDVPKATETQGDSDGPRRGSLCDRHCSTINNLQGDLGCHLYCPHVPPAVSPPSCCQQHSEEVCESCVVKTTLTAENAVEANKLSNNYKVGGCGTGGGTHGCSWMVLVSFLTQINVSVQFGFKKWKSHVTARPWEDRSEIVKELYSDLNVIRGPGGSTVTFGNVLYLLLFGWWLSVLYVLVAAVMFVTIVGAPYGRLCWDLASYFLWPFGKVIQKVEVPKSHQVLGTSESGGDASGAGESSALLGGPVPRRWRPRCCINTGYWRHAGTVAWLCLGYPVLALAHGLACVTAWLLVVLIPVAKLSARAVTRVLLLPPKRVLVRRLRMTEVPLEGEVILCCHRALNPYYYKYAVDGINVFAVNLLPLVLVTLVLGYVDSHNHLTSSPVKFTLALLSIMPLSYYIGMAIASISAQSNFAVGAVVNATFGSITELTFYITALIKGSREGNRCYAEIVKSALTGTLVGCVLFVPMDNNGTLYYSHVQPLVYTVSLLLPAAYLIGLFFTLKTHSHIYDIHISDCHMPGHHHSAVVHWSRWRALVILLLSTLCMSACADLATEHISPILTNSTISQYFIGVTVLAMVPELPEIVNGIQFALQNNLSLSIEIGNCIAVQVCMLQIPILVLFTIFYPTNFTLVFSDLHVYASMFSVVLMNYIFMDGKCDYFQGTVLVMVYFILLAVYFFAPSPSGC